MKLRVNLAKVFIVWLMLIALIHASFSASPASAQVVPPGPPVVVPQDTVPCNPLDACTRGGNPPVNFVWADIVRFCNGDAIPTPPGQTTFGLIYGNGSLSATPAVFSGSVLKNGVEIPSNPLTTLLPGERDSRFRQAVVSNNDVFTVLLTAVDPAGNQIAFGNGATIKRLEASGSCPDAPTPQALIPPAQDVPPPVVITSVPEGEFPPTL